MEIEDFFPIPVASFSFNGDLPSVQDYVKEVLGNSVKPNDGNFSTVNKSVLDDPQLLELKTFILDSVNEYFETVISAKGDIKPYITMSWANFTNNGGFHHRHTHPNSIVSGSFYIFADDAKDSIVFHKTPVDTMQFTPKKYNKYNSNLWKTPVKEGKLVLFPSWFTHSVGLVKSPNTRVSLSFNVFVKGQFGSKDESTWIEI
jgi:uncharacterized protein (TIGR02466 family)